MSPASRREDVLRAASELFYEEGFRAVGVDAIAERAGISKMTIYNHFGSKDELGAAYLLRRDEGIRQFIEGRVSELATEPRERLLAIFDAFAEQVERDAFRGCHLINAFVELTDRDHPARRVAVEQNERWRAYVLELARAAGLSEAEEFGDQLFLLLEGALVTAVMERSKEPMRRARRAAELLLLSHGADSKPSRRGRTKR